MSETWEETKARLNKKGIGPKPTLQPKAKFMLKSKETGFVKRYNIHKRSLPVGIDVPVVYGVTKTEAEWWVENILKAKAYQDDPKETKTVIYYDIIPDNATPREQSVYFNPKDTVPEF